MEVGSTGWTRGLSFKFRLPRLFGRIPGRDDEVADLAHGGVATASRGRKEDGVENLVGGIGNGQRASDRLQYGKVVEIIADVSDRGEIDAKPLAVLVQDGNLVVGTDEGVTDTQALAPVDDGLGLAGGDDDDFDTGCQDPLDSDPIAGVELAHLAAIVEKIEAGIGEHAVDVQRQEFDPDEALQDLAEREGFDRAIGSSYLRTSLRSIPVTAADQGFQFVGRQRAADVKPLHPFAPVAAQKAQLLFRLHPLGDHV